MERFRQLGGNPAPERAVSAARMLAILALLAISPACARTVIGSDPAGETPLPVAGNAAESTSGIAAVDGVGAGAGAGGGTGSGAQPRAGAPAPTETPTVPSMDESSAGSGSTSMAGDVPKIDRGSSGGSAAETWIGELWSIAPLLCDPEVPWNDADTQVIRPEGYIEPVVIVLDAGRDLAAPQGLIAFGQGELPATVPPEATTNGDRGPFWLCSIQIPSKGGVYPLHDTRRSTDRFTSDFVPAAIWDTLCDGDFANCLMCPGIGCGTLGRAVTLDLIVHGDTMEGTFLTSGFGTPSELRLTRQR
jgi:hypothetical protein